MLGLYAWGANSHGQLGLGYSCEMVCEPHRVDELPAQLCESAVACIVGGGGHTLLLTNKGSLYGAGWNNYGQVGEGTASRCVSCFRECRGLEGQVIVAASCGWAHSVACSTTGHVWVWGNNTHGQLGLPPHEVPFSSLPICLELSEVVSVAAGLRHTVVATRSGEVYTWGQGHRGQLGHLSEDGTTLKMLTSPKMLDTLETKVVSVSCGQNMTYAITSEGALLAWGDNKWGQLAHDPRNLLFFTCPLTIPSNYFGCERISWVRAGWTHCVAGTMSGAVYVWGRADYGQLGPQPCDEDDGDAPPGLGRDLWEGPEPGGEGSPPLSESPTQEQTKYRYIPSLVTVVGGLKVEQLVCGSEHTLALMSLTNPQPPLPPSEGYYPPHLRPSSSSLFRRQSLPSAQSASEHFAQMGHQSTQDKLQKRIQPVHQQQDHHHIPPRLDTALAGGSLDAIPIPAGNSGSTISMTSLKEGGGCSSLEAIVGQNEDNILSFNEIAQQQTCLSEMSPKAGSLSQSPAQSASLDSVSAVTTDSGTASSTSDHSSALKSGRSTADPICVSVSPQGDGVTLMGQQRSVDDDGLPRLTACSEVSGDVNDQPSTLSPIDSPRTIAQYSLPIDSKIVVSQEQRKDLNNQLDNILRSDQQNMHGMPRRGVIGGGQSQYKPINALQPKSVFRNEKSTRVSALHMQHHNVPKQGSSLSLNTTSSGGLDTRRISSSFAKCIDFPCIYSWGWNEHGNCGLGSTENVTLPQRVPVEGKVLFVAAGSGHSFALIRNYCKVAL